MDIILIFPSVIFLIISLGIYLETYEKSMLLISLLLLLLFVWCLIANIVKEPVVSRHIVQNLITENGSNYQVISYENDVINLNSATGKSYEEGQIIEVKRYNEIWSLGVFCLIGNKEFSVISERIEE